MLSSRTGLPRRPGSRRWSVRAGLAVLGLLASTGCQVEYAGMTLPSGKYFHDDVQYFAPGPEFPYANTQAATQRARMQAAGIPVPPVPGRRVADARRRRDRPERNASRPWLSALVPSRGRVRPPKSRTRCRAARAPRIPCRLPPSRLLLVAPSRPLPADRMPGSRRFGSLPSKRVAPDPIGPGFSRWPGSLS